MPKKKEVKEAEVKSEGMGDESKPKLGVAKAIVMEKLQAAKTTGDYGDKRRLLDEIEAILQEEL